MRSWSTEKIPSSNVRTLSRTRARRNADSNIGKYGGRRALPQLEMPDIGVSDMRGQTTEELRTRSTEPSGSLRAISEAPAAQISEPASHQRACEPSARPQPSKSASLRAISEAPAEQISLLGRRPWRRPLLRLQHLQGTTGSEPQNLRRVRTAAGSLSGC